MDSARAHAHPPPTSSSATDLTTANRLHDHASSLSPEPVPSRQRRLLETRNARFAGKKLSISDLGTKFTQLIHANEQTFCDNSRTRNKENAMPKDAELNDIGKSAGSRYSLGILEEISNTARNRMPRRHKSTPVYHDNQERPLLDQSPYSSPAYRAPSSEVTSPTGFDHLQHNLTTMHLHDLPGNDRRNTVYSGRSSEASAKGTRKRRSTPFKPVFDTQDYIDYIEKELEQAKEDLYSPTTNKSLKDQLRASRNDNERLKQEIFTLRDTFETEVKRTVEHKTAVEAELKIKVKDLEEELEKKELVLQSFQHRHEDKRLETNTIETLKAAIERLEHDKAAMEDENRSMSKRNEVLSELLAMSPTKSQAFELRSPVREKRSGRPMSLILPRQPSSPVLSLLHSSPTAESSSAEASLLAQKTFTHIAENETYCNSAAQSFLSEAYQHTCDDTLDDGDNIPKSAEVISSSPAPWSLPLPTSPPGAATARQIPKRKPRKFMSGSTQLKPLLLPALTAEIPTPATPSDFISPRSTTPRDFSRESFDLTSYFAHRPLRSQSKESVDLDSFSRYSSATPVRTHESDSAFSPASSESQATRGLSRPESQIQKRDPDDVYESSLPSVTDRLSATIISEDTVHTEQQLSPTIGNLTTQRVEQVRSPLDSRSRKFVGALSHTFSSPTLSDIFDLEALSRLEASEASYNEFLSETIDMDARIYQDVPQPLFSPMSRNLPIQSSAVSASKLIHVPFDGSLQQLIPRKRRSSKSSLSERYEGFMPRDPQKRESHSLVTTQGTLSIEQQLHTPPCPRQPRLNPAAVFRATPLSRSTSPLELLQQRQFGARPLATLTIKAIYGTISRCTSYVRDFKRDPLALARRVIANAWLANWSRYGKLSWWVLGLFLSPISRRPKLEWEWDQYDGEGIAQRVCQSGENATINDSANYDPTIVDQVGSESVRHAETISHAMPAGTSDSEERKVGWGKSLFLWGKFSVAVMLAVGGAVVKGPGDLLKDLEQKENPHAQATAPEPSPLIDDQEESELRTGQSHPARSRRRKGRRRINNTLYSLGPETDLYDRARHAGPVPSFTFRTSQQLDIHSQPGWGSQADGKDTLRPAKVQKMRVAHLFSSDADETDNTHQVSSYPPLGTVEHGEASPLDDRSSDGPASPGFIRTDNGESGRHAF